MNCWGCRRPCCGVTDKLLKGKYVTNVLSNFQYAYFHVLKHGPVSVAPVTLLFQGRNLALIFPLATCVKVTEVVSRKMSFCFWSTSVGSTRAATEVRWCLCVTPEFHWLHVRCGVAAARFCSVRRYARQGDLSSTGSAALRMTIDDVCFCKPWVCSNFTFVSVETLSFFMFSFQLYVVTALPLWPG